MRNLLNLAAALLAAPTFAADWYVGTTPTESTTPCVCGLSCTCPVGTNCGCGMNTVATTAKRYTTVRVQVCDGRTCHYEDRVVELADPTPAKATPASFPLPMPGSTQAAAAGADLGFFVTGRPQPVRALFGSVRQWFNDHRPHLLLR